MKFLALAVLFTFFTAGEKLRYENYQVYRLTPENDNHLEALFDLSEDYNFWREPGGVNRTADVLVAPHQRSAFQQFISSSGIPEKLMIQNVQSLINLEELKIKSRCKDMEWTNYHKLEEIYDWIDEVAKKYPFAKKVIAGKTYEGRRITGLEITFNENNTGVFIESGMHGREWITPAATSWVMNQILESPSKSVFRNYTYFYFPVFNPDGYAYSWTHDRLWKKTRTPYRIGPFLCHGADPNKNWDFQWNKVGSSDNPCSDKFAGPSPFSEVEMKSMASYLKCIATSRNVNIYLAFHSYSQLVAYPWDHSPEPSPHHDLWQRIGEAAAVDLKNVHGTEFEVGNSCQFLRPSSGVSRDWYYDLFESTVSFTYHLRDTGLHGFLLPAEQIIPSGEELLASLKKVLIEYEKLQSVRSVEP